MLHSGEYSTEARSVAKGFLAGFYDIETNSQTWLHAFRFLSGEVSLPGLDPKSVHTLWTANGGCLRNKLRDDELLLAVLRRTLPRYQGPGIELFRGECSFLFEEAKVGLCWTPHREVAKRFAAGRNAVESEGLLIRAFAPPESILAGPNDNSSRVLEEFEYTCNPNLMTDFEIIARFSKLL